MKISLDKKTVKISTIIGIIGEILVFLSRIPKVNIIAGGVFSLPIIIYGLLEIKNHRTIIRAFAITAFILGSIMFLYFSSVFSVLNFSSPPSYIGKILTETTYIFQLDTFLPPDTLIGRHSLNFEKDADIVKVVFVPTDTDRKKVEKLIVFPVGSPPTRIATVGTHDPQEKIILIEDFTQSSIVIAKILAILKNVGQKPSVEVFVSYKYTMKTFFWRFKRWIFIHYG